MNKPLIDAALGRQPSRYPIWFLRQAGRYLPEYRAVRANVDFVELCRNPKLAAEVTLQPLRRFDLDAAIIFSDILIPCTAMGQELSFGAGHGPHLSNPVRSREALQRLRKPDAQRELGYVGEAIAETRKGLKPEQTMIGFAGAPLTVASYMIEGEGSKTFTEVKRLRFQDPSTFQGLLQLLAEVTTDYLLMQVKAGAECLMLFDTWANQLSAEDYREFAFPAVQAVIAAVKKSSSVPVIYYPGQGSDLYYELAGVGCDVIAVDWRCRMKHAIDVLNRQMELRVSVQGNLDPQTLIGPEAMVRQKTRAILDQAQGARGHIFNVGHGLLPHTPPEALQWVIQEVRAYTR